MTAPTRKRRGFGLIRRLPSGRYQASHAAPGGGSRVNAPRTFDTRKDAEAWLAEAQTDLSRGQWHRPEPPRKVETFASYAASWLATRKLTPRTADEYRKLLHGHLLPAFGSLAVDEITPPMVRAWHAGLVTGPTRKAHAYGLLHAIMATAVADDVIAANPARIRGATQVKRARKIRPAEPAELAAIAEGMRPAYQVMVLLAAWCGLRFGELAALRRDDIDLAHGVVRVRRGVTHTKAGPVVGAPKSAAGVRDVAIPPHLLPVIAGHLAEHTGPARDALLFLSPSGTHLRSDSRMHDEFRAAAAKIGRPDLTFHDLRHTGATLAAQHGATTAELQHRFGHSTPTAAMRYQHATDDRDQAIARALSEFAGAKVVPLRPRGKADTHR